MLKIILKKVGFWLIDIGFNFIFNTIDENKDGTLSKKEINDFSKLIISKVKRKVN